MYLVQEGVKPNASLEGRNKNGAKIALYKVSTCALTLRTCVFTLST